MKKRKSEIENEPVNPKERELEKVLRPLSFDDFAGQDKVVENLKIFVGAANGEVCVTSIEVDGDGADGV